MLKRLQLVAATGALLFLVPPATAAGQAEAQGVRLWSQNCGRCHNLRAATERTDREWVTIMAHMRARANLTRSTAEQILAFLQSTNLAAAASETPFAVAQGEMQTPSADGEAEASPRSESAWPRLHASLLGRVLPPPMRSMLGLPVAWYP